MSYNSYPKKRQVFIGLVALQCLFYTWVSSRVGFLADDLRYLYEIHKGNTPFDFVLHPYTNTFAWRPIADLSWVLNVIVSGGHSFPYHLFNVAIFVATLVVLFVVLRHVLSEKIALYATIIFAFMPTHNEAILWLSGRTDSLAVLLCLIAWYCYLRFREATGNTTWRWLWGSVIMFALAVLSKESVILAPVFFALGDWLLSTKSLTWKQRFLPLIPFVVVILGVVAARTAILGGLISSNPTFTAQYFILPTREMIIGAARALSFVFNHSTATAYLHSFPTLWRFLLLPCIGIALLGLFFAGRVWRRGIERRTLLLGMLISLVFFIPVFSLVHNITLDLMHSRLLYAPSLGIAIMFAALLTAGKTQFAILFRRACVVACITLYIIANAVNAQPWIEATIQTRRFVDTFMETQSEFVHATGPTFVYLLHTPVEYRGAYLFHDYYSVQQAIYHATHNDNLTVQTVGTKPIFPSPFCGDTFIDTHVLSWNGLEFDVRDDLIENWNTPITAADISLTSQREWKNAQIKVHDAQYHFENNALVLDHFGRYPQLMITLPAHSFVSHWKQLTLNSDASEPVDLLWNSTFNDQPAFNSIVVDPKATQELWLCAYPNWVVSGKLRTLSLAFSPNESTVTIHALTLHAEQ